MEKFVDRIIETDRKAREIIEQAQQEKQAVLADAKKRADAEIARRETEADKGRAAIDEEFAQREARESERMDAAYLDAKHALDNAFEDGHDAWLAEITQNTLAALLCLANLERSNIINVIEGVRYGLSPEQISAFLKY